MRRFTLVLLVALLALSAVTSLVGCDSSTPATGSGAKVVSEDGEGQSDGEAVGTLANPLPLGTAARIGDWEVAVAAVNTNANEIIAAENQFNEPPTEGSQFVLVSVQAKYVGAESGTFWVDMMYKFYGAGGNTFDSGIGAVSPNPIMDAGEAFPNASVTGDIVFEVPIDQIEGGAVIMEDTFSMDDTRVFFALK